MISRVAGILTAPRKSVSLTNLTLNGNFTSTSNWTDTGILSALSNEAYFTANSTGDRVYQNISITAGKKYYGCCWIKATSGANVEFLIGGSFATEYRVNYTGAGSYQFLSGIVTATGSGSGLFQIIQDNRNSAWDNITAKYASFVDITTPFGAGNEPNKQTMDNIMEQFSNKWLNGTQTAYYY